MAEKPAVVMLVSGRGGVPTIPDKPVGKPGLQDCSRECTGAMYKYMGKTFTPAAIAEGHNTGPSKKKVAAAMREVHTNEPSTVARADVSDARKEKMRQAIAFSKVRRASKK